MAAPVQENSNGPQETMLKHLVVDSGAIIKGAQLGSMAENLWTIEEVFGEVRDKKARSFLKNLPFQINTRVVSDEAMHAVVAFARKTGDFASLSMVDLKVLALSYMLEKEENGMKNINLEPRSRLARAHMKGTPTAEAHKADKKLTSDAQLVGSNVTSEATGIKPDVKQSDVDALTARLRLAGWAANAPSVVASAKDGEGDSEEHADLRHKEDSSGVVDGASASESEVEGEPELERASVEEPDLKQAVEEPSSSNVVSINAAATAQSTSSRILSSGHCLSSSMMEDEDDDGEGWVTKDNMTKYIDDPLGSRSSTSTGLRSSVGCTTTDFAMQNVLMQMGLQLISVDGMAVRRLKQWILQCSACFKVTSEMERLFCPVCGNNSLSRVSVSVDSRGRMKMHYRRQRKMNLKGSKYSIPKSKGGREGDLLLREDQLLQGIWHQRAKQGNKMKASAFGSEVTDNVGINVRQNSEIVVGYGRRNPNSRKGRERRGKKKRS